VATALLDRLADNHPNVRRRAIEALADRDSPQVTAALLDRLADENNLVRHAAGAHIPRNSRLGHSSLPQQ
jgi:HEAT repeat protein